MKNCPMQASNRPNDKNSPICRLAVTFDFLGMEAILLSATKTAAILKVS
jgi:hypothetical protein